MDIHKLAGTTLGNYEIESLLGKGGMGVVYKARQISLNRNVALKILPPALSSDESFVKRFQREAHAVARLNHPNIVHIYDIGEEEGLHFFSMEYVDGKPLDELVRGKGRLTADEAIEIISQAALAIEHAHEHDITHRDIKPSNIMIDNRGRVKVMDFGLARSDADRSRLTQIGTILGTLVYMSPEQCLGEEIDQRTDIYSLGVALYEMLAGDAPFMASNEAALIHKIVYDVPRDVETLNPDIPRGLCAVVARAMAKDREDRYQNASDFLKDINNLETLPIQQPVHAKKLVAPKSPAQAKRRGFSKKAKLAIIGLLVTVLVVPIAAILIVYAIISSLDYSNLKTTIEQAVEDTTGRELSMPGDVEIEFGLTPSIIVEDVRFQNASWGSRPEMATIKRFELEMAILPLFSGNLVVRRLVLVEPDILLETSGSGESNIDFLDELKSDKHRRAPASDDAKPLELTLKKMQIEEGRLTYRDGATRRSYMVVLDELDASSKGGRSPVELELDGEYNGSPFELNGSLGPLTGVTDAEEPWRLTARAEAAWASVDIDGIITDVTGAKGIDLNVSLEGESISDAAAFFGISDGPDVGPYKLSARITDPSPSTISFSNMEAALGQSNLTGSIEIATAGERPRLTASLKSRKMDLRPFMPEDNEKENKTKKSRLFPDEPLPLDTLDGLDADIQIRVRQVLLPRIALDDLDADIAIDSGTLSVKQMKAGIGGGSLDSRLELRQNGNTADLDLQLKIDQLDIGQMLEELDITDVMKGELEADINLNANGGSVAELMAGLNGSTLAMGSGQMKNKYIDLLDADLASGVFRLLDPYSPEADYTELNCFVSRFDIRDGLARTEVLVADTDAMTVEGKGDIDLRTERLDMEIRPTPKKGAGAAAKISLNIADLTKPFRLSGTLAEPQLAIDPTLSPSTLGQALLGTARSGSDGLPAALLRGESVENPCLDAIGAATGKALPQEPKPEPEKEATVIRPDETQPAQSPLATPKRRLKKLLGR
jgi:serine/threonine protein kinase